MTTYGTMEIIETKTLVSDIGTIEFLNINQSYDDIFLLVSARTSTSALLDTIRIRFNDNSSNYTQMGWFASGSSTTGALSSSTTSLETFLVTTAANSSSNHFSSGEMYISGYSTNLTKLIRGNSLKTDASDTSAQRIQRSSGAWNSSSSITKITLTPTSNSNFVSGSTFTLYGVKGSNAVTAKATGGVLTEDNTYYYHTFASSGTFTPLQNLNVDYLVIGGGGSGGGGSGGAGGGGGAGGLKTSLGGSTLSLTSSTNYSITVGAGGPWTSGSRVNGSNSTFHTVTATGGGGGGHRIAGIYTGANGGSGGGGSGNGTGDAGGTGISGEGNNGGSGGNPTNNGGGGGGAGQVGSQGQNSTRVGGQGGNGVLNSITGTSIYYAGGGGGGCNDFGGTGIPGAGGAGGGGTGGGTVNSSKGSPGLYGSGSGGGGAGNQGGAASGGNGGSGIVIIRYAK